MYIIDNKKDYYDGVVGSVGVDKEIVYKRKTNEFKLNDKNSQKRLPKEFIRDFTRDNLPNVNRFYNLKFYKPYEKSKYNHAQPFVIGFCGKLYVGYKLFYEINRKFDSKTKYHIFYKIKNIKKHLRNFWGRDLDESINSVQNYNALHIFREFNTPIFIIDFDKDTFIVNPLLKDYNFYRVFDSFRAFQEIQMFISGVLGVNEKEMIEVSNEHKIKQHGFDYKWSFRKEPSKHKK